MVNSEFGMNMQEENTFLIDSGERKTAHPNNDNYTDILPNFKTREKEKEAEIITQAIKEVASSVDIASLTNKDDTSKEKYEQEKGLLIQNDDVNASQVNNTDENISNEDIKTTKKKRDDEIIKANKEEKHLGDKNTCNKLSEMEQKKIKRRWLDVLDGDIYVLIKKDKVRAIHRIDFLSIVGIPVQRVADICKISIQDAIKLIKKAEKKTKTTIFFVNDKKYELKNRIGEKFSKEQIKNEFNKKDGYITIAGFGIFIEWFFSK